MMEEYKQLAGVCSAVRWMASECILSKAAAEAGFDALVESMPTNYRTDWDDEQVEHFQAAYENRRMKAVITAVWWPAYEQEKATFPSYSNPDANPWT